MLRAFDDGLQHSRRRDGADLVGHHDCVDGSGARLDLLDDRVFDFAFDEWGRRRVGSEDFLVGNIEAAGFELSVGVGGACGIDDQSAAINVAALELLAEDGGVYIGANDAHDVGRRPERGDVACGIACGAGIVLALMNLENLNRRFEAHAGDFAEYVLVEVEVAHDQYFGVLKAFEEFYMPVCIQVIACRFGPLSSG